MHEAPKEVHQHAVPAAAAGAVIDLQLPRWHGTLKAVAAVMAALRVRTYGNTNHACKLV
jgi:hypothetical protein